MAGVERTILCGGTPAPPRAKPDDLLTLDLNGPQANVNLKITNITQRLSSDIPDVLADLIEIATYVYSADQAVTRGGDGVVAFGQYWRRKLTFHIPVRALQVWSSPVVLESLRDTLSFLSDDEYDFRFGKQQESAPIQRYLELSESAEQHDELDEVMLFSGGLDSLAGAVREGVCNRRRVALVSHRSNPKIYSKQKQLVEDLNRLCAHKPFHIPVWANKDKALGRGYTQRTRSFLYATLAFAVARAYGLDRLKFYENGVVSLNLPISEQVIGARATRTTHPQVLKGFAKLFSEIIGSPFAVEKAPMVTAVLKVAPVRTSYVYGDFVFMKSSDCTIPKKCSPTSASKRMVPELKNGMPRRILPEFTSPSWSWYTGEMQDVDACPAPNLSQA